MKTIKLELERKELREIITNLEISLLYISKVNTSLIEDTKKLIDKLWEQY